MNHSPLRLRRARIAAGLSQAEAAARAGCTQSFLCQLEYEHYQVTARPALLARLAEVYGRQIIDLMPPEKAA